MAPTFACQNNVEGFLVRLELFGILFYPPVPIEHVQNAILRVGGLVLVTQVLVNLFVRCIEWVDVWLVRRRARQLHLLQRNFTRVVLQKRNFTRVVLQKFRTRVILQLYYTVYHKIRSYCNITLQNMLESYFDLTVI